jgi:5-methylcytosine-specific restriction protein A
MATAKYFERELNLRLEEADSRGIPHLDISSGAFHRDMGGYPGPNHRMPVVCGVLYKAMRGSDRILHQPPSGFGASVRIRYFLPRR